MAGGGEGALAVARSGGCGSRAACRQLPGTCSQRAAEVYAFVDAGGLRRKRATGPRDESAHVGYGFRFRAQVPSGALDLSFGLGDERSFAGTKGHVSFVQRF